MNWAIRGMNEKREGEKGVGSMHGRVKMIEMVRVILLVLLIGKYNVFPTGCFEKGISIPSLLYEFLQFLKVVENLKKFEKLEI